LTAYRWAEACGELPLSHERIPNATPNKNAHMESWHAILERECLANQGFATYAEAYQAVTTWIAFYNERRMHGSLDDWPPAVFYARCRAGTAPQIDPVACYNHPVPRTMSSRRFRNGLVRLMGVNPVTRRAAASRHQCAPFRTVRASTPHVTTASG
jgi:putative transposase